MATKVETACRICGSKETAEWLYPREMMFGLREKFSYFRCASCECLQIDHVPTNLDKYYPANYYSYQKLKNVSISWRAVFKRLWVYPAMTRYKLGWGSVLGRWLCYFKSGPLFPHWLSLLARPVSFDCAILDVGCGSGGTLLELYNCGFTNLRGIDPFIAKSITYTGGFRIDKSQLQDLQGKFDLITFNHVFEHLENPLDTLQQARRLLSEEGQILIRIPLSDSQTARQYRENWLQLDAPRHIMLHTRKSMDLVALKSRLKIDRVTYDSTDAQFWGSELYLLDICLSDPNPSHSKDSVFSPEKMKSFAEEAERLNKQELGDQAAFVLSKEE